MMRTKWLLDKYTGQMSEILCSAHITCEQSRAERLFRHVLGMFINKSLKKRPLGGVNLSVSECVCPCRCVCMSQEMSPGEKCAKVVGKEGLSELCKHEC